MRSSLVGLPMLWAHHQQKFELLENSFHIASCCFCLVYWTSSSSNHKALVLSLGHWPYFLPKINRFFQFSLIFLLNEPKPFPRGFIYNSTKLHRLPVLINLPNTHCLGKNKTQTLLKHLCPFSSWHCWTAWIALTEVWNFGSCYRLVEPDPSLHCS